MHNHATPAFGTSAPLPCSSTTNARSPTLPTPTTFWVHVDDHIRAKHPAPVRQKSLQICLQPVDETFFLLTGYVHNAGRLVHDVAHQSAISSRILVDIHPVERARQKRLTGEPGNLPPVRRRAPQRGVFASLFGQAIVPEVLQLCRSDLIGWFDAPAHAFGFGAFQMASV